MRARPWFVWVVGLSVALLYLLLYTAYPEASATADPLLWLACLAATLVLYRLGFDYRWIKFSFGLSFLAVFSLLYDFFTVLIGAGGVPRSLAFFLAPLVFAASAGYLYERLRGFQESRGARRGVVSLSRRIRSTLYELDPLMWFFLVFGSAFLVVFLLTPIGFVLINAFRAPTGAAWYSNFQRIFSAREYVRLESLPGEMPWFTVQLGNYTLYVIKGVNYGILANSLVLSTAVTFTATLLGIAIAFVLARYRFPGKETLRILSLVPLFVTPFVNSYVVKILFSEYGPISMLTQALFGWRIRLDGLVGVALAQIISFYPIVYLNAYSAFLNVDPSTEEQAENLGARGFRLFRTVTLPLALPGIVAGAIIVFIFSLEDVGAPLIFQEWNLMSAQIFRGFVTQTGIVSPESAALGVVMLFVAVVGFLAIRNYVGMRSYAMISRGGRIAPRQRPLGLPGKVVVYAVIFPLVLLTSFPQLGVALLAFNIMPPRGFEINPGRFTLSYFENLFLDPTVFTYIRNTLTYAALSVLLALAVAVMVGYGVSRIRVAWLSNLLDTLATVPLAIPGLVIALGYYYFFTTFFAGTPLDPASIGAFQAWVVLVVSYSVRKLPYVVRSVYAGFQQVHVGLEEAAMNLGATRARVVFGVVLPYIISYIFSGAVLGFIYMATEVSTSITIGNFNPSQAPMTYYMMNVYKGGSPIGVQIAAAMGVLLILIQLVAILIVVRVLKQRYAFIGV
ncbi:iron ABC transporter permease [Infirmifilum lucidum]|uniref:Iron ABC transporter permease n=1 Tax=Infirmifilum lucidum TaxID=2776706 RepID=A0A7L9FFZ7_9CREN|nr:iron ABC transporter permease [Infirmifilum lucidum]QOJ78738.1 iron ABC transporter permease [Infirmifilum lucidum]